MVKRKVMWNFHKKIDVLLCSTKMDVYTRIPPKVQEPCQREGSFKRVQEPCQQGKEALRGRRGGWERSSVFCTKTAAGSTNSQQLWLPARGQLQPLAEEPLTGDDLGGGCYGYGPGRLHTPKDGSYMSM